MMLRSLNLALAITALLLPMPASAAVPYSAGCESRGCVVRYSPFNLAFARLTASSAVSGAIRSASHSLVGLADRADMDGAVRSRCVDDPRLVARSVLCSVALVTPVGVRNTTSRGSGFVVDFPPTNDDDDEHCIDGEESGEEDGEGGGAVLHLLTAAHVALPGHRIDMTFPSGAASASATVVGRDARADLALLRVTLADSDVGGVPRSLEVSDVAEPEVGTPAFAIGYPSGGIRGAAMTSGIVCAPAHGLGYFDVRRDGAGEESERARSSEENGEGEEEVPASLPAFARTSFVVTDAAMAGGMSGGPLVDNGGVVLGVNALVRPDLRALGNYAVDASECQAFLSDLARRVVSGLDNNPDVMSEDERRVKGYRVLLYNDGFNKRERVSQVLGSVGLNATEAENAMMGAHTRGRSVVREFLGSDEGARDAANGLCERLREMDVLVEVEDI